ncbi:aminoglycoside 3'-phosphotransferase [Nocardiopsis algeriensis]|uniref:Kanamycin kinase n=1 Tax=Nocardiopsis algeriensis TaxID=1478215 RepID=A0A841IU93_9ACTN|nr:aminoglycoside 3'-phosphotransferase [Nocardiopsis algeriensis]MBB6121742.1 kanamycin kinase [Nocardiopsis algeriensis]
MSFAAKAPEHEIPVPRVLARLVGGDPARAVWVNRLGGVTWSIAEGTPRHRYLKWAPAEALHLDPEAERRRMEWAARWVRVPRVLDSGEEGTGRWLLTEALPGTSAVAPHWSADPGPVAAEIGRGLRVLHEALPCEECPFDWSDGERLERVRERLAAGEGPERWAPEHRGLSVEEALARLENPPAADLPVVCHGDACAPNTLLGDDGRFLGHVDLGRLGTADRWADLAVASWSLEWNYGPGHEEAFFEGYGVAPDTDRIAYYRLLWDLS